VFFRDISERKHSHEQIAYLAQHDHLTGLANRHFFHERLDAAFAYVRRGAQFAILWVDLDHFKAVNDTFGHSVGDALLRQVGQRLQSCVREIDTVARLGGDEFAIIQMGLEDPADARRLAQRVVDVLQDTYELEGQRITTGASIGIAVAPEDGIDFEQLCKNADIALYQVKAERQGGYRFFLSVDQ
jgi:diguanylate cyclase (GGDEF)-like protein